MPEWGPHHDRPDDIGYPEQEDDSDVDNDPELCELCGTPADACACEVDDD